MTPLETAQEQLQTDAKEILKELTIMNLLATYGRPKVVGSMALGVMTRKDIDIEILVKNYDKSSIGTIVKTLAEMKLPRIDFSVIDHLESDTITLPKGYYIGIKYSGQNYHMESFRDNPLVWQIDCWFVTEENAISGKTTEEILQKLTPEKRKIILEIKHAAMKHSEYKKTYTGLDIYNAVLNRNIQSFEELQSL